MTTSPGGDEEKAKSTRMLQPFAQDVWIMDGPVVNFFSFPYPTRMVIIKLSDGSAWVWSPIALTEELANEVLEGVGPVKYLISPNAIHWLFMKDWQDRFPDALMFASPGLATRKIAKDLKFHDTLTDEPPTEYSNDIDQLILRGGVLDEVVFFHKVSKTVIFCDLIQRHFPENQKGLRGWLMHKEGVVGPRGSTPKEWIFTFWAYGKLPEAREKLDVILNEWRPQKLIIAHGQNHDTEGATVIIENCLPWIPKDPNNNTGCIFCYPKNQYD